MLKLQQTILDFFHPKLFREIRLREIAEEKSVDKSLGCFSSFRAHKYITKITHLVRLLETTVPGTVSARN